MHEQSLRQDVASGFPDEAQTFPDTVRRHAFWRDRCVFSENIFFPKRKGPGPEGPGLNGQGNAKAFGPWPIMTLEPYRLAHINYGPYWIFVF